MIIVYTENAYKEVEYALEKGLAVKIICEVKQGTPNSAVYDFILTYSPEDLEQYPDIINNSEPCETHYIELNHIDREDLKTCMVSAIKSDIAEYVKFSAYNQYD